MKEKRVLNVAIITLAVLFVLCCVLMLSEATSFVQADRRTESVELAENLADSGAQPRAVSLYRDNAHDGERFAVNGMLPGDQVYGYYEVDVSFKNTVTVSLRINVRDGYEKLGEVLKFKVENLTTNDLLYDGIANELPYKWDNVFVSAVAEGETIRMRYGITAYLETSVGNEYVNLPLVADFYWFVDEDENLIPTAPKTGENLLKTLVITSVALGLLLIIMVIVRSCLGKEQENRSLKKFKRGMAGVVVLFGVLCTTTIAYAYYVTKEVLNNEFTTGEVDISLSEEGNAVGSGEILLEPGAEIVKDFKVTNDSTCEVYYKLYFSDIEGELAEVLEVTVLADDEEVGTGILSELLSDGGIVAEEALEVGEDAYVSVLIHMPEECGNEAQAQKVSFELHVDAVQVPNNPDRAFE